MRRLTASLIALVLVTGCGGSDPAASPTRTPGPDAAATPTGVDVATVNKARDSFIAACAAREKGSSGGAAALSTARETSKTLVDAFKASPDEPFRRSPNTPAVSMRERLKSLALVARKRCGGGGAVALGNRLARVAARDAG